MLNLEKRGDWGWRLGFAPIGRWIRTVMTPNEAREALQTWRAQGDSEADYRIGCLYRDGRGVFVNFAEAAYRFRRASARGHVEAKLALAQLLLRGAVDIDARRLSSSRTLAKLIYPRGDGLAVDAKKARFLLQDIALKNGTAAELLGWLYLSGEGGEQDFAAAHKMFERAVAVGQEQVNFGLGEIYAHGYGVAVNLAIAVQYYEKAAAGGHVRAKTALACLLHDRGESARAAALFTEAAEGQDAAAQYRMGMMLLRGEGLSQDCVGGETWLRAAAKQGHVEAMSALGALYSQGNGYEPNLREAEVWFRRAAEAGDVVAQFIAGRFAATGDGSVQNLKDAARYFLMAAQQGHLVAMVNVAAFYASGEGFAQDLAQSRRWYAEAAEKGFAIAQTRLARMLLAGQGGGRDRRAARAWLEKAAAQGEAEGKALLATAFLLEEDEDARAATLLTEAANAGYAEAAYVLSTLLQPKMEALSWLMRAAEAGHIVAQFELGVIYCTGKGLAQDMAKGAEMYRRAAEGGHRDGMHNWGVMLMKGLGVEADVEAGQAWLAKAQAA